MPCYKRTADGRGKKGRLSFCFSPVGRHISAALPLDIPVDDIKKYRQCCAFQVKLAIEQACGSKAEIKNTDDIYVNGEKVCGILIECMVNAATLKTECAFVGVGIYTGEAEGVTCHICAGESRNKLAADIFRKLKGITI